ncbi:hypothetical protein [uncultured Vagococcus sp.]|uniref:hypothetical protein n=1 Tax=uncultured Vagococcus sp. TaxID=189676 RepID=UPI00258857D4|nr:hypothetical protein [uncultured Vagococcus sp.]
MEEVNINWLFQLRLTSEIADEAAFLFPTTNKVKKKAFCFEQLEEVNINWLFQLRLTSEIADEAAFLFPTTNKVKKK